MTAAPTGRHARIEVARGIIREFGAEAGAARLGRAVEQAAPRGSAADDLLGPQGEISHKGSRSEWDVSMCEKWAVEKVGVTLEQYRGYLVRTYGSATELDGMMLWDQRDVLVNAARDPMVRTGLARAIMAAARRP